MSPRVEAHTFACRGKEGVATIASIASIPSIASAGTCPRRKLQQNVQTSCQLTALDGPLRESAATTQNGWLGAAPRAAAIAAHCSSRTAHCGGWSSNPVALRSSSIHGNQACQLPSSTSALIMTQAVGCGRRRASATRIRSGCTEPAWKAASRVSPIDATTSVRPLASALRGAMREGVNRTCSCSSSARTRAGRAGSNTTSPVARGCSIPAEQIACGAQTRCLLPASTRRSRRC